MSRVRARFTIALALSAASVVAQDDYQPPWEMTNYVLGLLQKGPAWSDEPTPENKRLQAGHLKHLGKMFASGELQAAGPVGSGGELRGILLFHGVTLEQAQKMASEDPRVKAGHLRLELISWLGRKGFADEYRRNKAENPDSPDVMEQYQLGFLVKGKNWTSKPSPREEKLQSEHLSYINRMAEQGRLRAAGPFDGQDRLRGLLILQEGSMEEALRLVRGDPKVKSRDLAVEMHPWWTAKGIVP